MNLNSIQEVQNLVIARVGKNQHVLSESFDQRKETSLGIEPGVGSELLLEWLKTLNDSANTKVVVTLGTVEGTNYKIDDTEVESLFCRFLDSDSIFLLLDALHEFLGICILTGHNVRNTEIGENDSGDAQKIIHLSSDEWFVVSDGVPVLVVLHEEDVGNVELPGLVLTAELGGLPEDFLHLGVVAFVPVDLRLHHEDWNILIQG